MRLLFHAKLWERLLMYRVSHVRAECLKLVFSWGRKTFVQVKSATVVLTGTCLNGANLIHATFWEAVLKDTIFGGGYVRGAVFRRVDLSEKDLKKVQGATLY